MNASNSCWSSLGPLADYKYESDWVKVVHRMLRDASATRSRKKVNSFGNVPNASETTMFMQNTSNRDASVSLLAKTRKGVSSVSNPDRFAYAGIENTSATHWLLRLIECEGAHA